MSDAPLSCESCGYELPAAWISATAGRPARTEKVLGYRHPVAFPAEPTRVTYRCRLCGHWYQDVVPEGAVLPSA